MSLASIPDGLNDVYESLDRYAWDDDVEFQSGLSAILGTNSTPEQAAELALRARCFYYARKFNKNIDFDAYKAYRNARGRPPPTPALPSTSTPAFPASTSTPDLSLQNSASNAALSSSAGEAGGILPAPTNASEPAAPYPTSFAHIVDLITSGKPVPGIKEIPPTVLTGQGTEATKARRKKPWEKDDVGTGEVKVEAQAETQAQ